MPLEENKSPRTDTSVASGGLIQSPNLKADGSGTPQRSIRDVGMAKDIISTMVMANRSRQIVNNRIMAKYNAERPYDQEKLKSEGLGWRSNFTTKPLPQMVEKVAPRFVEAIEGLKYLTNSTLPSKFVNASTKSEVFREKITTTMRARKGWKTLVEDIALDNALFGYTSVAWLDKFSVMPQHFAQDESFFPDGTKQSADKVQVALLLEVYLPHELFDYVRDADTAKEVGWNVAATVEAINNASPNKMRDVLGGTANLESWYQNAQRELTVGSSYMAGANVILVYSLLVREVTGKISHYRFVGDKEGSTDKSQELYTKEDCFDSMFDCLSLFTFQKGNKRLHGSKGIGRDIYELAGMQDRLRNEVVDRGILSGKTFVQGDMKMLHRFKMSVVGSMLIVPDNWKFLENKVDGNIDSFLKLDAYFSMLVDQLIGSVSPRTFQGDRVTKAEVDLFASREEEGKDARISRFMGQFVDMVGTIQKRLCDPDTVDADAKQMQKELLETMTREEMDFLANQPVAGTVRDLTPNQRQMIAAICAEKKGNPLYNQRALENEDLVARAGAEFSEKVLLKEEDPTEIAEQQRMQLLELGLLSSGQPVPVSVRDNHAIHIDLLLPALQKLGEAVSQGASHTGAFEVGINHLSEHYNFAVQSGVPEGKLAAAADLLSKSGPVIAQLKELDKQAQELQVQGEPQPPA